MDSNGWIRIKYSPGYAQRRIPINGAESIHFIEQYGGEELDIVLFSSCGITHGRKACGQASIEHRMSRSRSNAMKNSSNSK